LGQEQAALASVRANVAAWAREIEARGLDAIVINASGCGVMVKDYGFLLRHDPRWAGPAAKVAALARDVCEVVAELGLGSEVGGANLRLAYHAACSLQHGQKIFDPPEALLRQAGFSVMAIPEGHICCGSAGSYSLLQPDLSIQLRQRKVTAIESLRPAMIATGNIGCLAHIAAGTAVPVLHTVELLDWATGGPQPIEIETQSY
jgi:glycolate oxidase iron-sulfur subunit